MFVITTFQRGEMKCEEIKDFVQAASKWWRQDESPSSLVSESVH